MILKRVLRPRVEEEIHTGCRDRTCTSWQPSCHRANNVWQKCRIGQRCGRRTSSSSNSLCDEALRSDHNSMALKHTNQVIQMLANFTGVIVIKVIQILESAREREVMVVHRWRGCIGREVECTFHYDLDTLPCCS